MKLGRSLLLLLAVFIILPMLPLMAQTKVHHVLFAVTSDDKADWGLTLGNVRKIIATLPPGSVDIEVVGWGRGVTLLTKGSEEEKNIEGLQGPHVRFLACEFSLANRKLSKADILPGVDTVPVGVIEAVSKQEQGWSYIKGGR